MSFEERSGSKALSTVHRLHRKYFIVHSPQITQITQITQKIFYCPHQPDVWRGLHRLLITATYILFTVYFLSFTAYCLLFTVYRSLFTVYFLLFTVHFEQNCRNKSARFSIIWLIEEQRRSGRYS